MGLATTGALILVLGVGGLRPVSQAPPPTVVRASEPVAVEEGWTQGIAAHYGVGTMERVSRRRGLPVVGCMASSPWHPIGTWYRITSLVTGVTADCRITDVSAPEDEARHRRKGQLELGWSVTPTMCGISRVGEQPPRACPIKWRVLSTP